MTHAGLLGIPVDGLHAIRRTLERELGERAPIVLQEIGFALGDSLYGHFTDWVRQETGTDDPSLLDRERLGEVLSSYFAAEGWGTLALEQPGKALLVLRSDGWAEANPAEAAPYPNCLVTCGLISSFLSRIADQAVAVMEVRCRSTGDDACTFLVGSPETLQTVYDAMAAGRSYTELLA